MLGSKPLPYLVDGLAHRIQQRGPATGLEGQLRGIRDRTFDIDLFVRVVAVELHEADPGRRDLPMLEQKFIEAGLHCGLDSGHGA